MDRGLGKKKKLQEANMPTTNHLLVIGINNYREGIPKLNNAVKDAKAFEALLNKKYDFKSEHIVSLYNEDATTDNILDAFDTLIKKLTADDNLVFYFSGHGELIETTQQGYWIPVEARANRRGDYLINTEIKNFVAACHARHILCVIDACYSGSLLRKITNPFVQKYFTKPSRRVITSGLIEPVPDGIPNHHSPFAAALLSSLKHNKKPYLSTSALWQDMQEGLAANSFASAQFESMHGVGHQGGDFFFLATGFEDIPEVEINIAANLGATKEIKDTTHTQQKVETVSPEQKVALSTLSTSDWKTALKRMAVTNLKRALTKAEDRIDSNSDAFNSLLLLQSRYHSAKKNQDAGLVTDQQSNISFNRIKAAFSGFIDDLEDYDVK